MPMNRKHLLILCLVIILTGCGRKIKLPTNLPELGGGTLDTTYVPIEPDRPWVEAGGILFNHPQDVHVGFDGYIYIADTDNDRIVKLDQSGNFIHQYGGVKHPSSVSQDRLFRLLATGGNTIYKKGAQDEDFISIYIAPDIYNIDSIIILDTVVTDTGTIIIPIDTLYRVDTLVTIYEGIAPNPLPFSGYAEYYACDFTRSEITRFLFYEPDSINNLGPIIPMGYDLGKTFYPLGIFTYLTPTWFNLIFSQFLSYYSVQLLNGEGEDFSPVIPRTDSSDIYWQSTFGQAEDVTVDEYGNIFVVDSERNSVLKFSENGVKILSFGSQGAGAKEFQNPKGIAYSNKIVYVADTGNNRILRFMLSTDIPK
jgi:DNA-binding beta-propeller fold protein YncE